MLWQREGCNGYSYKDVALSKPPDVWEPGKVSSAFSLSQQLRIQLSKLPTGAPLGRGRQGEQIALLRNQHHPDVREAAAGNLTKITIVEIIIIDTLILIISSIAYGGGRGSHSSDSRTRTA